MRRPAVPLLLLLAVLPGTAVAGADLDPDEIELLRIINAYRAANGLGCLTPSPTMNAAATYMSRAMGELGFFSHNEPPCDDEGNCTGRNPFDRIRAFGHDKWTAAAENIACGYPTPEAVFEGWKNSPRHNANMLLPEMKAIGIGREIVDGSSCRIYWTNNFSDWIDGDYDCEGNWNGEGPEPGSGGEGGSGGTGGTGGTGGAGGSGGNGGGGTGGAGGTAGPKPRREIQPGDFWAGIGNGNGSGGGCAAAGGPATALLVFAIALLLRRR